MHSAFMLCLLVSLASCSDPHWGVPEEDDVAVLNKNNFDAFLTTNPYSFVEFYAPWCGHCKTLAPIYSKLAKRMKKEKEGIAIAKIDATDEKELAEKYGVQGFPTLKLFINGEPIDYQGGRDEDSLYSWLKKKAGPSTVEIVDKKTLEEHAKKPLSVLFLHPEGDSKSVDNFAALASQTDDVKFGHSSNPEFKQIYGVEKKYGMIVFRNFDDGNKIFEADGSPSVKQLKEFFEDVRYPLALDFDQKAAERIFGNESSAIIFFTDNKKESQLDDFKKVAEERRNEILFASSAISSGLGAKLAEFVGVKKADAPAIRIMRFDQGHLMKYIVSDLSKEGVKKALDDFKADKLYPYHKSDPTPQTNNEPVKVVVGNNFGDMVIGNDKYVLLESYAPWCGHCKQLDPIYKELAEKVAHVEDLVIAKMDATANEHPSVNVRGFPTIHLFKPGSKDTPELYTGERTFEDLLKFLEEKMDRKLTEEDVKTEEL